MKDVELEQIKIDEKFMRAALKEAQKAYVEDEVPIGAVIVKDNNVISYGYNSKESEQSVLCHAELIAIEKAEKYLNNWRLDGCDMYVTLDPCPMCASAIKQSRIHTIYSAVENSDKENSLVINNILKKDKTNPEVKLLTNLDVDKSKILLNSFFELQRNK